MLLLGNRDHELVSIAHIAKLAGSSVGAFYQRWQDKDHFLRATIEKTLRHATDEAERELDPARLVGEPPSKVIRQIVQQMIAALHGLNAGVIRTAIKRSQLEPSAFEPVLGHRTVVADRAVAALAHREQRPRELEQRIRTAVQVGHAGLLDVLLHKTGPLREGDAQLAERLSEIMSRIIGLKDRRPEAKPGKSGEPTQTVKGRSRKGRQFI
jgi:AcrR family transcriptional regulator